jgi:hypothetical protein
MAAADTPFRTGVSRTQIRFDWAKMDVEHPLAFFGNTFFAGYVARLKAMELNVWELRWIQLSEVICLSQQGLFPSGGRLTF